MNVPFVDLKLQYQRIKKEIDSAVANVFHHTRFIQGPEVSQFEEEFARYNNTKYCIGVNSGTDALILGMRALGLSPGDEVIVPVNTFIATVLGIVENKLTPVFVDIDPDDYGMDLGDLQRKISTKTKAILLVHLYGQPEKLDEIQCIIRDSGHRIYLIEDACQAHGAVYKGKKVGTTGVFSAYSFYPGKNLGAYGDAGAIVTNDDSLAARVKKLREYGQTKKYYHESWGVNSRLDTMQAAVLLVKLRHLEKWNKRRQELAGYYTKSIHSLLPNIKTPIIDTTRLSVFHLYVIEVENRDALVGYLGKRGVTALIHYPVPMHLQKACALLGYKKGDFPNAENASGKILSLPMFPELTKTQINYTLKALSDFITT